MYLHETWADTSTIERTNDLRALVGDVLLGPTNLLTTCAFEIQDYLLLLVLVLTQTVLDDDLDVVVSMNLDHQGCKRGVVTMYSDMMLGIGVFVKGNLIVEDGSKSGYIGGYKFLIQVM